MKTYVSLIALLFPVCLWAETPQTLVERLVGEVWAPRTVRVEWQFNGKAPAELERFDDWQLTEPRPFRVAGNVILTFVHKDSLGTKKVTVIGTARVFGMSLTVKNPVAAEQPVDVSNLDSLELEWTKLNGEAAQISDFAVAKVATRGLTPGRVITTRDIKGAKIIHRGQTVDVEYADGPVHIRISGRALKDAAAGETLPVATDVVASKSVTGKVADDGSIQWVR